MTSWEIHQTIYLSKIQSVQGHQIQDSIQVQLGEPINMGEGSFIRA